MVVGAKVCGFLWFVCGNFDVSPIQSLIFGYFQSQRSYKDEIKKKKKKKKKEFLA